MSNPFAAIETTVNTVVNHAMSNATATIAGASVAGVFLNNYGEGINGLVGGSLPAFQCLEDDAPSGTQAGSALRVGGSNYTVASAEPDGTGWLTLVLRRA